MLARQRIEAFTHALQHLKIMPAVLRCSSRAHFGLSASDIKAYVLNRHLKTLAGILFDLPAKQALSHCGSMYTSLMSGVFAVSK